MNLHASNIWFCLRYGIGDLVIHHQDVDIHDGDPACLEVPASSSPAVRLDREEIDRARHFFEQEGLTRDVVAVAPGASDDLKRWPVAHFARLCRYLAEDLGTAVLVLCGPQEAKLLHELDARTRGLPQVEIVQNLHLGRAAALLAQCVLYLGNDSGLTHLAAAVGTPVVVLFGPTVPYLYPPHGLRSQVVTSGIACPYRPQRPLGDPRCVLAGSCLIGTPCIQAIDPAQVCTAVKEQYARCRTEAPS